MDPKDEQPDISSVSDGDKDDKRDLQEQDASTVDLLSKDDVPASATEWLKDISESVSQPDVPSSTPPQPQTPLQDQSAASVASEDSRSSVEVAAKKKRLKKMLLYIAGGVFSLFALVSVTKIIMTDDRLGTLIQAQAKGVQFMRPEKWVEKSSEDGFTYYTENGSDIDSAEIAVVLGAQTAPVDYTTLSDTDKSRVKGAFTSRPEALSGSLANKDCAEAGNVSNTEQQREGYDLAYMIEATCNKLKGKDTKGTVKIVFGWKGNSLQIFAVMADDQLWQQNQEKLDKILASAKPL